MGNYNQSSHVHKYIVQDGYELVWAVVSQSRKKEYK